MTILSAVVLSTVAWFTSQSATYTVDNLQVNSKILESYFDETSGNGLDAAHPLVISKPVHLYNLSYLHESNEMKLTDWTYSFADQGLYFQFGRKVDTKYYFYSYDSDGTTSESLTATTLDMNYYNDGANRGSSLIPIGTTAHPFIGHIAGNDLTISNLHINGIGQADIGIFGYVGTGGSVSHCYFEKPVIDATGADARATSVEASPHTSYTNIGYLAGHITNANQFTNVYVNKAQLKNTSGSSYQMINSTGFFGKVDDPAVTPATSSTYAFGFNAKNAYDALDYANTEGSDKSLALRNVQDGFTASGTYTSAVTSNSSTYTFDQKEAGKPYSLSTIGYAQGENASSKHLRYKENGSVYNISEASWNSDYAKNSAYTEDGNFIYYDSVNEQWYMDVVIPSGSSTDVYTSFNCFNVSYTSGSTTYYWKYDTNNTDDLTDDTLIMTSTAPSNNDDTYYNFVFRQISNGVPYGPGISSLSDVSSETTVYIYSPEKRGYLYADCPNGVSGTPQTASGHRVPKFVTDYNDATQFSIGGEVTKFNFMSREYQTSSSSYLNNIVAGVLTFTDSTVKSHKYNSLCSGDAFTIGTPTTNNNLQGYPYQLVTSVDDFAQNDRIVIATYDSNDSKWFALGDPGNDKIPGSEISVDANNQIVNVSLAFKIQLYYDDTEQAFLLKSTKTSGNLSNKGSTGSNSAGRKLLLDEDECFWTISIDNSGDATIISNLTPSIGNKQLQYNTSADVYCVYPDSMQNPKIFRKADSLATLSGKESVSFQKSYWASGSSSFLVSSTKELWIADDTVQNADNPDVYYLFKNAPTQSTTITKSELDSRVTTTDLITNYWRKVTSEYQMNNGDSFIIVNESDGVAMSMTQNTNDRGSVAVTATSGFIKDSNLSGSVQKFTGLKNNGKWTFATSGGYIAAGSSFVDSLVTNQESDANAEFTVSFTISGNATITFQGSYSHKILGYDSTNDIFSSYESLTGTVQIYRLVEMAANNSTYVGDLVGGGYEPNRMDVVGSASFVEDGSDHYLRLNESCNVVGAASPNGTKDFHATAEVTQGGVVIIIDNTGSNDLGSLVVTYQETNGEKPYFKDKNNTSVSFSTCARDKDTNASDHIHEDVINFSSTNISSRAYCGLDSDGKIVAINADASKYVLVIGADSTIKIRDIQFSFTNIPGNIGKFSSVDFRTATYTDGVLTSSQPSQNGIAIYYDINDSTLIIDIRVTYVGSTYNVYINSNKATTITVFLYDESASLNVNGTAYYATSNQCNISANYTIPNSWDGSA